MAVGVDTEAWTEDGSAGKLADVPPWLQAVANETADTASNILRAVTIVDRNPSETFILSSLETLANYAQRFRLFYLSHVKSSKPSPVPGR